MLWGFENKFYLKEKRVRLEDHNCKDSYNQKTLVKEYFDRDIYLTSFYEDIKTESLVGKFWLLLLIVTTKDETEYNILDKYDCFF